MLTATLTAFFPTLGKSEDIISVTGLVLLALQTIVLVLSILPTERALKRTFTDEGERRNP